MKQNKLNLIIAVTMLAGVFGISAANAGEIIPQAGSVAIAGAGSKSDSFSAAGAGAGASAGASANNRNQNIVGSGNVYEASDISDSVPAVFVPALTTSNNTCANSFSGGGSGAGFGFSIGKTYVSEPCNIRFNANQMNALGYKHLAVELMCSMSSVFEADARNARANGTLPKCAQPVEDKPIAAVDSDYEKGLELAKRYDPVTWFPADEKLIGAR